ncbi:TatD family hydrolase [Clostridium culturomicium]|uniref:TatD family hydrolase n=1 Tax=Clostridium culturomicium TaxID=1499683 RepID=UPI0038571A2D
MIKNENNMYVDAHNHLDFYGENIGEAISDINDNKIITLANSMDVDSYILNKEYAKQSEYIIPTFGIHPNSVSEFAGELKDIIPYIEESTLIGEIGLDFLWVEDRSLDSKQREIFYFILDESIKRSKFVSIHTKNAEQEIYEALKIRNYNKAIIHWYSGPLDILDKLIELGCYFTISVDLGYSDLTEEVLKRIPLDKLLVETDGPTALEWINGDYGYPREIKNVVKSASIIKGIEEQKLIEVIYNNFHRIIN